MTEQELIDFGFQKEESLDEQENFYYYVYVTHNTEFISNADDEVHDTDGWWVEMSETDPMVRFSSMDEFKKMIDILKRNS